MVGTETHYAYTMLMPEGRYVLRHNGDGFVPHIRDMAVNGGRVQGGPVFCRWIPCCQRHVL